METVTKPVQSNIKPLGINVGLDDYAPLLLTCISQVRNETANRISTIAQDAIAETTATPEGLRKLLSPFSVQSSSDP